MEYVEEVSASVKLKRTIQDLVDAYLGCFHWKDTILILRIDDVDMSIDHASEMIETMRKYFVQPNLLVFVSGDLDQLWKIKTRDFINEFPDPKLTDWCRELADKYLSKVFPNIGFLCPNLHLTIITGFVSKVISRQRQVRKCRKTS